MARPHPVSDTCTFCRIVQGHDRSVEIVAEGKHWLAFAPLDPATVGHTLVISRAHADDFWALDRGLAAELGYGAYDVGRAIDRALSPDGMNLITSAGDAAEQTIHHVHLHVVPRWEGDGFGRIWPPDGGVPPSQSSRAARLIREAYDSRDEGR